MKENRVREVDSRLQLPQLLADEEPMEQGESFVLDTVRALGFGHSCGK